MKPIKNKMDYFEFKHKIETAIKSCPKMKFEIKCYHEEHSVHKVRKANGQI